MIGVKPRTLVIAAAIIVVGLFFLYAFWPRAAQVDLATIEQSHMMVTIDEEAKTRVRDSYVVSMPVAGRLLRVDVEAGDAVMQGETIVARIAPASPTVLDVRTEEQAGAAVAAAEAALALAKAEVKKAAVDEDFAEVEAERYRELRPHDAVSQSQLDNAERSWRAASAALEMTRANVRLREADLKSTRAMLMTFSEAEERSVATNPHPREALEVRSPISGRVLRLIQESETVLPSGAPVLEIGDPQSDLEIVAELLSRDAVKTKPGDRVIIEKWGGDAPLTGEIERIEPWGFTKFSALGVEEQRVNAIIKFTCEKSDHEALGHGYRTEVKIVVWEDEEALVAPSSALFRLNGGWAVFKVVNGRATESTVEIGRNNGTQAEILSGLNDSDTVILYPGNQIVDGARVEKRRI